MPRNRNRNRSHRPCRHLRITMVPAELGNGAAVVGSLTCAHCGAAMTRRRDPSDPREFIYFPRAELGDPAERED